MLKNTLVSLMCVIKSNKSEQMMQEEPIVREINKPVKNKSSGKIISVCAIILVTVLVSAFITFSLTVNYFFNFSDNTFRDIKIIGKLIDDLAYYEPDREEMLNAALKAYVGASGDRYTVYYTEEEFKALTEDNQGRYVGIGVTISEKEIEYNGEVINLIEIIEVFEASPADEVGIKVGDMIYSVHTDNGESFVNELGVDVAGDMIRGEEGTNVTLSILREKQGAYEKIKLTVQRRSVINKSVNYYVHASDPDVGVVVIKGFDLNTPKLFKQAVQELSALQIKDIVIDLRNNGGGDLNSVMACASYFLNEDDIILSTENGKGLKREYRATPRKYTDVYKDCSVTEEEIGMYRELNVAVLVNGNTASAAELLTAVFRDYKIATVIGEKTFGKGVMQTIYSLEGYGISGGIKITTDAYFPPCGVNYDGEGIIPNIMINNSNEDIDQQLEAAVKELQK